MVTVTNDDSLSFVDSLLKVPTKFGGQAVKLDFLVVEKSPPDIIIGLPILLVMRGNMDFGANFVRLLTGTEWIVLPLERYIRSTEKKLVEGEYMGNPSGNFTSDLSVGPESSESSEEEKFLGIRED